VAVQPVAAVAGGNARQAVRRLERECLNDFHGA